MRTTTALGMTGLSFQPLTRWLKRQKLTMDLAHHHKVAQLLHDQIANDTRALAYVHHQQAIAASQLAEVSQ